MSIQKTLLEIVQDILSDIDSEEVNSLSDSNEAGQIATIVENVFYDMVSVRDIPEHSELIQLTALSDSNYPTTFEYPENVKAIEKIWYDVSTDDTFEYRVVKYVDNDEFLRRTDSRSSDYTTADEKLSGTKLRINNSTPPTFYTSFDDQYIVMDSFVATQENTLQQVKSRAKAIKIPVFEKNDTFVPDVDDVMFPMLIAESRSRAMDFFKGGTTQKAEQAARRTKVHVQNDQTKSRVGNKRNNYGRHG